MTTSQTMNERTGLESMVGPVRFEHLRETLGIGTAAPRLSWTIQSGRPGWKQTAYELEAHTAGGAPRGQTGRVVSAESVLVGWPFAPLSSREQVSVRVRVWGDDGQVSAWSKPAVAEAALLEAADWQAKFIRPAWDEDTSRPQPGPLLRKEFTLRGEIRQARLFITALGVYEASLNGKTVGDHVMAPGWTSYQHRLRYQIFDVSGLLAQGKNALGVMLGDGWFRGRMGFGGGRPNIYGERIAALAQLEVVYADGGRELVCSDESWQAKHGPIRMNDIYNGEDYDARLEIAGWDQPGLAAGDWEGVQAVEWDTRTLFAPMGPPVRRTQELAPVKIFKSPSGKTLLDFGQNLVGKLRVTVSGPAGQTITLRHAEVLENGELGTRPLRYAKATDTYILKGNGKEVFEPRFTFHGFRFAEVEGWPGELRGEDITAVVCHSDMERTGWFECSNPLINRLHENVLWSMRGNFFDIPTDCPQRDERLGWTGDIQVFSPTASFIYDAAGFLSSWLRDVAAEQISTGTVPFVVPITMPSATPPAAAWGDAAAVIPWVLYQRFGDVKVLADQFDSMKAWVDQLAELAGESRLWDTGFQFGDWLDPAAPPENPAKARTPFFIVATAYFARSAELTGLAARVLGRETEAAHYLGLAAEVRAAFTREYVTPSGRLLSDSSTAYALALEFALLPDEAQRKHAAARLGSLVRNSGFRISTGFVGTPLICDALLNNGYEETAWRLITQKECPSWLYPVTMGATTIWERWDSMLPDGSINPGEMTSFNHYALGAVADWLHRSVAGLAPAEPGYRSILVQPRPGGGVTHASARHITPYGPAAVTWKIEEGKMLLEVEVPPNTSAKVVLPGKENLPVQVGAGKHTWAYTYGGGAPVRKPLSVESTIGELIDDAEAFPLVMEAVRLSGTELAESMLAQESRKMSEAFGFMPRGQKILEQIAKVLADLNR